MYYTGNSRDFSSFKNKGAIGRECKSNDNNLIFIPSQWQHYRSGGVVIGILLANSSVGRAPVC